MQYLKKGSTGAAVRNLQAKLNQVLKPVPLLDVDGIFGSMTDAAVRAFQAKSGLSVDGIVGPNTQAALDAAKPGGTSPVPPPAVPVPPPVQGVTVLPRVHNLIPRALERQKSAVAMLGWARIAIDFPDTNEFNKAALKLVHRCFKIFEAPGMFESLRKSQWRRDIDTITQVYQTGISFLSSSNAKAYFAEQTDAEVRAACGKRANAYTHPGAFSRRDPSDGIWVNKDIAAGNSDDWLLDALTHEFAHFCGPSRPDDVDDHGYGDDALLLSRPKALKNAANHAWFAGLSQTGQSNWPNGTYPS